MIAEVMRLRHQAAALGNRASEAERQLEERNRRYLELSRSAAYVPDLIAAERIAAELEDAIRERVRSGLYGSKNKEILTGVSVERSRSAPGYDSAGGLSSVLTDEAQQALASSDFLAPLVATMLKAVEKFQARNVGFGLWVDHYYAHDGCNNHTVVVRLSASY